VVAWIPFYGVVVVLTASLAAVFLPGIGYCTPVASILVFCRLMGAFFQAATGDVHQTSAALVTQIAYTERYSGPLLYQVLGLVTVMILSILMFQRNAKRAERAEGQSEFRFWAAGVSPVLFRILFWAAGWFLLGTYLLMGGMLFVLHAVSRLELR
jgi:hypothetical protein